MEAINHQTMMKSKDKNDNRKMKSHNSCREQQKLALQQNITNEAGVVYLTIYDPMEDAQAEANITRPNCKRGQGNFTTNLLFPPSVPTEIRDQIYAQLVVLPRPIFLVEEAVVADNHFNNHLRLCTHGAGSYIPKQKSFIEKAAKKRFHEQEFDVGNKKQFVCTDPFTEEREIIKTPASVLDYRLICKEANGELAPIFWLQNKFYFKDADNMSTTLDHVTKHARRVQTVQLQYSFKNAYVGYAELVHGIRHVTLTFSSTKAAMYTKAANQFLTNVRSLEIILYHDQTNFKFDKEMNTLNGVGRNPLSMVKGIDTLAKAFSKHNGACRDIAKVTVKGTDLVYEPDLAEEDINHVDAIGPVIWENILNIDGPWMSGDELRKAAEDGKKRAGREEEG